MSLFVAAIFSGFGPWCAFSVSRDSQSARLVEITARYEMYQEALVLPLEKLKVMSDSDMIALSSITSYLIDMHGKEAIQPFVKENIDSLYKTENRYGLARKIMENWNLKYMFASESSEQINRDYNYSCENNSDLIKVLGYSYYFSTEYYGNDKNVKKFEIYSGV